MKTIELDFANCKYAFDLYKTVIDAMGFPDWCGKNPDAIWDMLKGEEEAAVNFKGINALNKSLQQEALEIFAVFADAEKKANKIHPVSY